MKKLVKRLLHSLAAASIAISGVPSSYADDTELLLLNADYDATDIRTNILFIVDTSLSMASVESALVPYDTSVTYTGPCNTDAYYWTETGVIPACEQNVSYIRKNALACNAAVPPLLFLGSFTNRLAQYREDASGISRWQSLQPGYHEGEVECQQDAGTHGRGALVYARRGENLQEYTQDATEQVAWGDTPINREYTIFDGNYLNWRLDPQYTNQFRFDVAKRSLNRVLRSLSNARVGIMRFNSREGGTVIKALSDVETQRGELLETINRLTATDATTLSETLYEAALYWRGMPAYYGERVDEHQTDPEALASANPEIYARPQVGACTRNYNVILSDGFPHRDEGAARLAPTLPDFARVLNRSSCMSTGEGACMEDIAEYLSMIGGDQGGSVITYTIGFREHLPQLERTAEASGGEYFQADDERALVDALSRITGDANARINSFASPLVAVNSFNRTQHVNELYMTVFQASTKTHWPGNVKKYSLANGQIVDANGLPAVDQETGFFSPRSKSIWTRGDADGAEIQLGGAANLLPDPALRQLFTNNGFDDNLTSGSNLLTPSNSATFTHQDFGMTGSAEEPSVEEVIRWARGEDIRDEDANPETTVRYIMGDPLHSRPAAIDYGGAPDAPDIVIFAATNDGYLHAIDGRTGVELWSFVPKELLPNLARLYFNPDSNSKHYGIDGDISSVTIDANNNGIMDQDDRAYIVFGLRRGGNSYYAIDVTEKLNPRLMWHVTPRSAGQSWSTPVIARVAIDTTAQNNEEAVVILGGGYDPVHDTPQFPSQPDGSGSSVLMLDLLTGQELWRASADSNADLRLPQMTRSIPSRITVTDINGDGFADRMYAADLGGQIWRFDIWAGRAPDRLVTGGVIARFGAEGTGGEDQNSSKRFYNSPDIALFTDTTQNRQYLSVSLGSGYRAHPLNNEATDRFYSLRDPNIFNALSQAEYDAYDIATDADMVEVSGRINVALTPENRGWKLTLPPTQKVLTDSVTFDNSIFFVGFSPDIRAAADCRASVGRNFLYRVNVVNGDPVVNNRDLLTADTADDARSVDLAQGGIAPSPTFLFPSSGEEDCEGESCLQPPLGCVGVECFDPGFVNRPVRTLWTQDGIQ